MLAFALSGCGTFEVSIYHPPTLTLPVKLPTGTPTTLSLTQTPTLVVSQRVPFATSTPMPDTILCDRASFVSDISVPDGTRFQPRQAFTKTWRLTNIGTCAWTTNYSLVFVQGEAMTKMIVQPLRTNVSPGETIDLSINMVAPNKAGEYTGYWGIRNPAGVWVLIEHAQDQMAFYIKILVEK
jgi:hypothetical protein